VHNLKHIYRVWFIVFNLSLGSFVIWLIHGGPLALKIQFPEFYFSSYSFTCTRTDKLLFSASVCRFMRSHLIASSLQAVFFLMSYPTGSGHCDPWSLALLSWTTLFDSSQWIFTPKPLSQTWALSHVTALGSFTLWRFRLPILFFYFIFFFISSYLITQSSLLLDTCIFLAQWWPC